jgi:hypothetical protein
LNNRLKHLAVSSDLLRPSGLWRGSTVLASWRGIAAGLAGLNNAKRSANAFNIPYSYDQNQTQGNRHIHNQAVGLAVADILDGHIVDEAYHIVVGWAAGMAVEANMREGLDSLVLESRFDTQIPKLHRWRGAEMAVGLDKVSSVCSVARRIAESIDRSLSTINA